MILVLGIYFQSFRAIILSGDGTILGVYRLSNSLLRKDGFYDFPIANVVDYFLKQDIEIKAIQQILIMGKPIIFFENFLKECLVPPRLNNVLRFGKGVGLFFDKIFRIKRDISKALRHEPQFSFLPYVEACLRIPKFLSWSEDILILEPKNEYAHSVLIRDNGKKVILENKLSKELDDFQSSQDFKRRMEILHSIRQKLKLENGLLVSNSFGAHENQQNLSTKHFFDSPTLLIFAMCDLYFEDVSSSFPYVFKERFSKFIGFPDEEEIIDLKLTSEVLDNLWKNHSAFHTIYTNN